MLAGTKQVEFVLLVIVGSLIYIPELIGLLSLAFPGAPVSEDDRSLDDVEHLLTAIDSIDRLPSSPLPTARDSLRVWRRINTVVALFLLLYYTLLLPGVIALLSAEFPSPMTDRSADVARIFFDDSNFSNDVHDRRPVRALADEVDERPSSPSFDDRVGHRRPDQEDLLGHFLLGQPASRGTDHAGHGPLPDVILFLKSVHRGRHRLALRHLSRSTER